MSWRAVVETMSLSRIIKSEHKEDSDISDFSFRQIGQSMAVPGSVKHPADFVPMAMLKEESGFTTWNDPSQEEQVEKGPPVLEISEEELNQRISDAFNSGLQDGKNLAERGLVNVFRALRTSTDTILDLRDKVLRESEDELINLIMLISRKVIIREISQDRCLLADIVRNAIATLSEREEITVRLNPDDYSLVTTGREACLQKELVSARLLLKSDPIVAVGFCQVDTVMGTIDANLDAQMDEIYRHLLEQRTISAIEGD